MNRGQYIVDQIVNDFEEYVSRDGFTKIVYAFMQLYYRLTNPKLTDYQKMLETFHQHHYHEFLFQYKDRNKKCVQFIETLKDFPSIKKPKKKDYQTLFAALVAFKDVLGTLPGGHVNGIPFIFTARAVQKWFYDEVVALRKKLGVSVSETPLYPIEENNKWTGHTLCPANCVAPTKKQTFGTYLIQVGYETVETVKRKWTVEAEDAPSDCWALFQENVEAIDPVLSEIQATASKAVESVVKLFHSGTRPEDCREHVREYMVSQYEPVCKKLRNENTRLKRKYDQLVDSSNEGEMMLSLQRRKTKDAYEDNEYLKKRLDSLQTSLIQTERANDRLKISYQQQQQELQQSIQREWHYYNQQQQRFR